MNLREVCTSAFILKVRNLNNLETGPTLYTWEVSKAGLETKSSGCSAHASNHSVTVACWL